METCPSDTCQLTPKLSNPGWRLDTLRPLLKKFQHNLFSPPIENIRLSPRGLPWSPLEEERPDL